VPAPQIRFTFWRSINLFMIMMMMMIQLAVHRPKTVTLPCHANVHYIRTKPGFILFIRGSPVSLCYSSVQYHFKCLALWLGKTSSKMTYFFVDSDFKPQSINQTDRRNHYCEFHGHWVTTAFSALTLLAGRQEEHPTCKNWVMRWLHMVQLMLLPSLNPTVSCLI